MTEAVRAAASPAVTRVVVTDEGPVLVDGPVEVVAQDGTVVRSERNVVALCTCRRSKIAPFCDTSHRTKVRPERQDQP
jgi:CDGSH-type Zn-finger protein